MIILFSYFKLFQTTLSVLYSCIVKRLTSEERHSMVVFTDHTKNARLNKIVNRLFDPQNIRWETLRQHYILTPGHFHTAKNALFILTCLTQTLAFVSTEFGFLFAKRKHTF